MFRHDGDVTEYWERDIGQPEMWDGSGTHADTTWDAGPSANGGSSSSSDGSDGSGSDSSSSSD